MFSSQKNDDVSRPTVERNRPTPPAASVSKPSTITKNTDERIILGSDKVATSLHNQTFNATMAFSVPEYANINDEISAQLLIDTRLNASELMSKMKLAKKSSDTIKVSKIVVASLIGSDFEVTELTPVKQAITNDSSTEWLWKLKPKTTGTHEVNLSVTAIIKTDNESVEHHIKTFERAITIEIKPKQLLISWVEKYWQWIFTTLLLPILLWISKKIKDYIAH